MKKIISYLLVLGMVFSISPQVLAVEAADDYTAREVTTKPFVDVLTSNTRSTSVPKEFYDLSEQDYEANMVTIGARSWLYTNYYFSPNSDNEIHVIYDIEGPGVSFTKLRIGLYDITSKEMVTSWLTDTIDPGYGISGKMYFYNLDPEHYYAVAFRSTGNDVGAKALSGTATIYH